MPVHPGQPLHPRRRDRHVNKTRRQAVRQSDRRMERGAREQAHQLFGDLFGTTQLSEIIVESTAIFIMSLPKKG